MDTTNFILYDVLTDIIFDYKLQLDNKDKFDKSLNDIKNKLPNTKIFKNVTLELLWDCAKSHVDNYNIINNSLTKQEDEITKINTIIHRCNKILKKDLTFNDKYKNLQMINDIKFVKYQLLISKKLLIKMKSALVIFTKKLSVTYIKAEDFTDDTLHILLHYHHNVNIIKIVDYLNDNLLDVMYFPIDYDSDDLPLTYHF